MGPLHVYHTGYQMDRIQLTPGVLIDKQIASKEDIHPNSLTSPDKLPQHTLQGPTEPLKNPISL